MLGVAVERTPKIEQVNLTGGRLIREAKVKNDQVSFLCVCVCTSIFFRKFYYFDVIKSFLLISNCDDYLRDCDLLSDITFIENIIIQSKAAALGFGYIASMPAIFLPIIAL